MSTIIRHGAADHFIRPDGVYRTGVIAPVTGYNPAQDVMSVAEMFTRGPYDFRQLNGMQLMDSPIKAWWLRLKASLSARFASKRAAQMMAIAASMPPAATNAGPQVAMTGLNPVGSASQMGPMINAEPSNRSAMLALIAANQMPEEWGNNALEMIAARWNNGYRR